MNRRPNQIKILIDRLRQEFENSHYVTIFTCSEYQKQHTGVLPSDIYYMVLLLSWSCMYIHFDFTGSYSKLYLYLV